MSRSPKAATQPVRVYRPAVYHPDALRQVAVVSGGYSRKSIEAKLNHARG